jgi:hypothetical protein
MHYPTTDWLDQPVDPNEEQDEPRDPDCPTTAEYDADPSKYIWIRPFGKQFRVYTYDTEAKDGYEIVTICDAPTMAEAEQARTDYIAKIKPTPIGIAAVLDDIMRRFATKDKCPPTSF